MRCNSLIIDFTEQLYKLHLDNEFDIPIIADAVSRGAVLMEQSLEIQVIARAAVKVAVSAGIDPTIFEPVNMDEFYIGGYLFFTGKTEEWEYMIAGTISDVEYEEFEEDCFRYVGQCAPHPVAEVHRKTGDMDHWQVYHKGRWRDDGVPLGYLEGLNERGKK